MATRTPVLAADSQATLADDSGISLGDQCRPESSTSPSASAEHFFNHQNPISTPPPPGSFPDQPLSTPVETANVNKSALLYPPQPSLPPTEGKGHGNLHENMSLQPVHQLLHGSLSQQNISPQYVEGISNIARYSLNALETVATQLREDLKSEKSERVIVECTNVRLTEDLKSERLEKQIAEQKFKEIEDKYRARLAEQDKEIVSLEKKIEDYKSKIADLEKRIRKVRSEKNEAEKKVMEENKKVLEERLKTVQAQKERDKLKHRLETQREQINVVKGELKCTKLKFKTDMKELGTTHEELKKECRMLITRAKMAEDRQKEAEDKQKKAEDKQKKAEAKSRMFEAEIDLFVRFLNLTAK